MKPVAEPCYNNTFKIHVPASNFKQDPKKTDYRLKESAIHNYPLMNQKLKLTEKRIQGHQDIAISYKKEGKRGLSKKKKIEPIPLMSNLKSKLHATDCHSKMNIIKYQEGNHKNRYNLIFTQQSKWKDNQIKTNKGKEKSRKTSTQSETRRSSMTANSTRALFRRNISGLETISNFRKSMPNFHSELKDQRKGNFYETTYSLLPQRSKSERNLKILGKQASSSKNNFEGKMGSSWEGIQRRTINGDIYYIS